MDTDLGLFYFRIIFYVPIPNSKTQNKFVRNNFFSIHIGGKTKDTVVINLGLHLQLNAHWVHCNVVRNFKSPHNTNKPFDFI